MERCLREGETCNIASAGYDSTVCRCVEVFKADFVESAQDLNQFANQTSIIYVSGDENGNVMVWQNNEKIRYNYFFARQKYSYKRLLALGEDGEQYVDSFRCNSFLY